VKLITYSGAVKGSLLVSVCQDDQAIKLPLLIVENKGPSLLGCNWLQKVDLNWQAMLKVGTSSLQELFQRHTEVFKDGLE